MKAEFDIVNEILEHRLQQDDVRRILGKLSSVDRDEFTEKIAEILSKVTAILEVTKRVSDTLSLDTLLDRIIQLTTEVLDADRSTLFLHDPETQELFSRMAQGGLKREIRFPESAGIAGTVFVSGKPIVIPDAYADARFNPEIDRKTGYRTRNILCAPIRTKQQRIIGVTQVLNKREGDFTVDDLTLLEAITSQASAALQNAQLFEQVEKARAEETKLLEVTTAISSELQLEPLLLKIMRTTTEMLEADRSTLFLNDEKNTELWSRVAQHMETHEIRFPNHLGIAGTVFTSGETINIADAYSDDRFNPEVDKKTGYRTRSILCMPVVNKEGKAIGVTQVLNKKGGPFTRVDEKRLRAFSAQASIAIENAQLFDDVLNMKNYNESILQSLSNGVITLDKNMCVAKSNAASQRILQADDDELTGRGVGDFFSGPNRWVLESIEKVRDSGKLDLTLDTELFLKNDRQVSINLTVVPLRDVKDEAIGSMLVLEDITREKRIRGTMARYMTKELAEKLLDSGEPMLGGQLQAATILFSDIRSFTALSERMASPQETVSMLNDYFTLMVDIIFEYGGILDKYIGDAIMAVFGAPFSTGEDADRATKAGLDMLRALREFNLRRTAEGKDPVTIGIGVNTGEVLSGNIGSMRRMDYTVIGDGVNLASRLEGVNKHYGTRILLSEFTYDLLKGAYLSRPVDCLRVKGKSKPVDVYEILDFHDESSFPRLQEVSGLYGDGLDCYRQRAWAKAITRFEEALRLNEQDEPSRIYLKRCRHFLEHPPAEDWTGVWEMQVK